MEWRDQGVVLSLRPHGESAAIVEIFTRDHGRCLGVVRGGTSRRMLPHLQPGGQVMAVWKARLGEQQLGSFTVEPERSRGHLLSDRSGLAALLAICTLLAQSLPERAPHPRLWADTVAMLDRLGQGDWPRAYLGWEMALLQEIGFGLDLSACAVTGTAEGLAYVSPKTGRAVSAAAAGEWAARLLPLPPGLLAEALDRPEAAPQAMPREGLAQGLALTGHFLRRAFGADGRPRDLPEARGRLADLLTREPRDPARG